MKNIKQLAIKEFMNTNDITTSSQSSSSQSSSTQTDSCTSSNGDKNNKTDTAAITTTTTTTEITTNKTSFTPSNKTLTYFNQDIVCLEHGIFLFIHRCLPFSYST